MVSVSPEERLGHYRAGRMQWVEHFTDMGDGYSLAYMMGTTLTTWASHVPKIIHLNAFVLPGDNLNSNTITAIVVFERNIS